MTRQSKTPQQRAEEALGVAQRRVTKAKARVDKAKADLSAANTEWVHACERRDYLATDPALPTPEAAATPDQGGES